MYITLHDRVLKEFTKQLCQLSLFGALRLHSVLPSNITGHNTFHEFFATWFFKLNGDNSALPE